MATTPSIPAKALAATNDVAAATDIRDIRGLIHITSWLDVMKWVAAFAVALLVGWLIYRWWSSRKRGETAAEIVMPPEWRARQRLKAALESLGEPREFCSRVSSAIRIYLEEEFSLRAPERTTEEFLGELQSSALLGASQKRLLAEFLEQCDLAKFAKAEPGTAELEALCDAGLRLVDETASPGTTASPVAETINAAA